MNVDTVGKLIMFDKEAHVEADKDLEIGDVLDVYRGNGPREGEFMCRAIFKGYDDNGGPRFLFNPSELTKD
jgi:hypothetical protein